MEARMEEMGEGEVRWDDGEVVEERERDEKRDGGKRRS